MALPQNFEAGAALNRRQFVVGMGAVAAIAGAGPVAAQTNNSAVQADAIERVLRFARPVPRREVARALRRHAVPHRWVAPDSLELHGWTIETPQNAMGFGWTSLDDHGAVAESWAEFVVLDAAERSREFEVIVGDELLETNGGRLVARVDGYPPVCLRDLAGRLRPRDHVNLLAKSGPIARPHRLVAIG